MRNTVLRENVIDEHSIGFVLIGELLDVQNNGASYRRLKLERCLPQHDAWGGTIVRNLPTEPKILKVYYPEVRR